jgi:hypothetical protein
MKRNLILFIIGGAVLAALVSAFVEICSLRKKSCSERRTRAYLALREGTLESQVIDLFGKPDRVQFADISDIKSLFRTERGTHSDHERVWLLEYRCESCIVWLLERSWDRETYTVVFDKPGGSLIGSDFNVDLTTVD